MQEVHQEGRKWWQRLLMAAGIYLLLAALLFWIVADDWSRTNVLTDPVNKDAALPELTEDVLISQAFLMAPESLRGLVLQGNVLTREDDTRQVRYRLLKGEEELLSGAVSLREIAEDGTVTLNTEALPKTETGTCLTLELRGEGGIFFWRGTTRSAGKFSVAAEIQQPLLVNGEMVEGELVMQQRGDRALPYREYYWPVALGLGAVLAAIGWYAYLRRRSGNLSRLNKAADLLHQYQYLLKTLVIRDFKVRYKASVLGVIWSFLNPLLMTFVYYFVFSTIFQNSIPNFPIYLMSGIVLYNYFSEATNMGMQSIVGNAGLITKVYMPKYIFPISKALSSAINLMISMIPLLIMMAVTGVGFHKSLLLMPVVILYLVIFSIGISLILSACMVYFRDIQFLWGILLTVLNFFSPIFYPESIIPARFAQLYHVNPLYQYLFFMRTITIGGVSPTPVTYLYCSIASFGMLLLGLIIFRKSQRNFVLHL